jgi:acetyl esterase/lipase
MPCFQLLIYPATDSRRESESMKNFTDVPLWNSRLCEKIARMYMPENPSLPKWYSSVIEAPSLEGLPPAYIEVADYDCLRDEGIAFAKKLQKAGVTITLNETKRTIHGYDIEEENEIVKESVAKRIKALSDAFYKG